ncbi:Arabidopsis thaliana sieve element occlusion-related 1, sieve element occlusion b [Hibiscus trionum]|uniref:Arabidopsis thaliana sieve element occlusion-related 1, sieve element occlusion b n=1 Tax=Hibiscus trionum TaxID=183268 RepID=A0A9W7J767_HIBTR|nr:Arabidopsis thaliana sieve element occlusion-related 1, sieve element occlusion b [Hibiscus trionum]
MDQQKKTTPGSLQAPMSNPTAAAQTLLHSPGAAQALVNNPGAVAQALLGNRGATQQPFLNNPGVGQQHMGVPGVGQQLMGVPGVGQQLMGVPGVGQQHIGNHGAGQKHMGNQGVGQQHLGYPGVGQQHVGVHGAGHASINKPGTALALTMSPSDSRALIRGDRGSMLSMSDDNVMMNQILATHAPDGREFDVKPLLYLVEDILNRATQHVDFLVKGTLSQAELEERAQQANHIAMLEALTFTIDRIACELSYKALGGSDVHATTTAIFNLLSSYAWDAKLVLSLSAFALNYGEFWLLAQIYSTNQLAKSMALLKQLPTLLEHTAPLKPRFDALNSLIRTMIDVTRCVVQFKELPSMYISSDVPALTTALNLIPTAVYWTIRSMVACATQISSLTSMGHEFGISTTESWELSTLAHKLRNIHEHLTKQMNFCYQYIDERRDVETYQMLLNLFDPNVLHIDNMRVLKALIYSKDDKLPLLDGSTKREVSLDVLRRKSVLLLISSLEFANDELAILEQIYNDSRIHATRLESQYEVVWIPIVDRSIIPLPEETRTKFENLLSTMPWYSVKDPLLIEKPVIRFIKEVWHFRTKPILVVLDPQGKVVSPNAIHMMWIWGSTAFPFTSMREEALWREETWRLDLLVDGIDPLILNWIKEGKYIFLYGGDNIDWVRRFTAQARSVASASRIPLEMVYVGKSNKREQVKKVTGVINAEKLSYAWEDQAMVWFFWTRLESMLFSKIQLGRADDQDLMMQQIKKLLSYDRDGGWAVLSQGSNIVVNGHSTTILPTLGGYDEWKVNVAEKGFDMSFKEYHDKLHDVAHPCCRFEFPTTIRIPESMRCPECLRVMEKYNTFLCCHDEQGIPGSLF